MRPFRMKCLWVVLLVLHSIQRANTVIPKVVAPGLVRGVVGDDLILPCYLENSVSAVDMDVLWLIGSDFVHRYKRHQDVTDNQLPEYRKRTTLSREEMLRGNVSLKISKVRLSDTNTYRCYVSADRGYGVASLHVQVNEFDLMTSAVSHTNGSTTLTCETPNWPDTTKPTLKWLDSKQLVLKDAHISYYGLTGTTFSMQGRVTVKEKPNNTYTCRVSYEDAGYRTEKSLEVQRKCFETHRRRLAAVSVGICAILTCGRLAYLIMMKNTKSRVLNRIRKETVQKFENAKYYTELRIVHQWGGGEETRFQDCTVEVLLSPHEQNLIFLQGESGYGKSFTAEKILHDWGSKQSYLEHYDIVLLLRCKDLVTSSGQSLLDLVSRQLETKCKNLIEKIVDCSPQKILFVIDGLDELSLSEEDAKSSPNDPFSQGQTKAVVGGLLIGHILSQSSMLVTTRPSVSTTVEKLCRLRDWKFVQILGLPRDKVTEYCKKHLDTAEYDYLINEPLLFNSCFNPMLCWMICEAMKVKAKAQGGKDLAASLGTTTFFYLAFFGKFLKHLSANDQHQLINLFSQAKEIETVQLNLMEILEEGYPFRRSESDQHRNFIHQSFLEFFASLSYVMLDDSKAKKQTKELRQQISANRYSSELGPGNIWSTTGHIWSTTRFLFGLSNKNIESFLDSSLGRHGSSHILEELKDWILERSLSTLRQEECLFLLRCLYELQEDEFTKDTMARVKDINLSHTPLAYADCVVLEYCMRWCTLLEQLDLRQSNLTKTKIKLLESVWRTLQCDDLRLTADALEYDDIVKMMRTIIPRPPDKSEQIPEKRRIINLQFLKTKLKSDDLRRLSEEVVPKSLKDSQSQNISCCLR